MRQINIGILGFGTVGAGVAKILIENRDILRARVGADLNLKYIADIDTETDRGLDLDEGVLISDAEKLISDPDIHIVAEMIGGQGIAKELILGALRNGKHVVTANKALIAAQGNEVIRTAAENRADFAFEASVGGCMPIIKTLRESLVGNRVRAMVGILNGTCNYILSKITDEGKTFESALEQAQASGFAEADPTLDVDGFDTAHKLAILNALAYGMEINLDDIYVEGISGITPMDIELAGQFGYRIKLLAISKDRGDAIEARIHPTMIPFDNMLSNVNANLNAVTVTGDAVGDMMLYGYGAGMMPTGSAVVGDIADIARNILCLSGERTELPTPSREEDGTGGIRYGKAEFAASGAAGRIPILSYQPDGIRNIPVMPIDEISTYYYFRFSAADRPGVLSTIAGILGKHDISIKSVHQKGRKSEGPVPIVMLTHRAKESGVKKALAEIAALDIVGAEPVLIRIEDENEED